MLNLIRYDSVFVNSSGYLDDRTIGLIKCLSNCNSSGPLTRKRFRLIRSHSERCGKLLFYFLSLPIRNYSCKFTHFRNPTLGQHHLNPICLPISSCSHNYVIIPQPRVGSKQKIAQNKKQKMAINAISHKMQKLHAELDSLHRVWEVVVPNFLS